MARSGLRQLARVRVGVLWMVGMSAMFSAAKLSAQPAFRNLQGTVTDRHHESLKGAIVEVENQNTHSVLSFITDQSGHYSFKRLRSDTDYRVWSTYRGHRSKIRTLSLFDAHPVRNVDLTIPLR